MEEKEGHTYYETLGSRLLSGQARHIVSWGMLAFLSSNFPWTNSDEISWNIELLEEIGCFFLLLPLYEADIHPRVAIRRFIERKKKKVTLFGHIVCRVAWGLPVPEKWSLTDKSAFACSHLCEAFWRWFFDQRGISENDYWLPCRWCVSPLCVHVERTYVNFQRLFCRYPTPDGCQCKSQPPCRFYQAHVVAKMEAMWVKYESFFKKSDFEKKMKFTSDGWSSFTPDSFGIRERRQREEVSVEHLDEDGTVDLPESDDHFIVEEEKESPTPPAIRLDLPPRPLQFFFMPETIEDVVAGLTNPGGATTATLLHTYLRLMYVEKKFSYFMIGLNKLICYF